MAAVHTQQGDVSLTPGSPQQIERMSPREMHYYLTEGLEGVEHEEYLGIRSFKRAVDSRVDAVCSGKSDQCSTPYLLFRPVTQHQLEIIERVRDTHYKRLRFLYLNELQALIVKIMTDPITVLVVEEFGYALRKKIEERGQGRGICSMGGTSYKGQDSRKEADGAFRPRLARRDVYDWPTVILECGLEESPERLAADARWWLYNSGEAVKIVILFFVSTSTKTITIEIWERAGIENGRVTQGNDDSDHWQVDLPVVKQTTTVSAEHITSTLTFSFEAIFLRAPKVKRCEGDYTLTEADLRAYYEQVWSDVIESSDPEDCKSILVRPYLNSN